MNPPPKGGRQRVLELMARAVGFEPTANRFTLLPRLRAVSDYVFTLGVTVRVSGARGWVIGWVPHHLVSTPSRLTATLRLAWLGVALVTTRWGFAEFTRFSTKVSPRSVNTNSRLLYR